MGIVDTELAEFELDGFGRCTIEQDVSGIIHLHIGHIRLELTADEFIHFVNVIEKGRTELRDIKNGNSDREDSEYEPGRKSASASGPSELTGNQRDALIDTFAALESRDIPYVVLKGYQKLPDRIFGSDIDLLIDEERFAAAAEVIGTRFAPSASTYANLLDLVKYGVQNPMLGVRTLAESPDEVVSHIRRTLIASELGSRNYLERTFTHDGLDVHAVNHLAYTSPMDGSRIRVAYQVDDGLLTRRVKRDEFYTPAPPDELAHLICRGLFDYAGTFPERYVRWCDELRAEVFDDPEAAETFETVLSHLFYDATPLVIDLVREGEYDTLRSELVTHDKY